MTEVHVEQRPSGWWVTVYLDSGGGNVYGPVSRERAFKIAGAWVPDDDPAGPGAS